MCVVAHQAIRQNLKIIRLRVFEKMEKLYIVRVIVEYLHFIYAANHHMVDAASRYLAWSTRHFYHLPAGYTADFEYNDIQYQIKGKLKKEELDEILKNLFFM